MQDLEQKFGLVPVTEMLASLRQLEARNPKLFHTLVSRAVLNDSGGWEIPDLGQAFEDEISDMIADDVATDHLVETIVKRTLVHITAEALF